MAAEPDHVHLGLQIGGRYRLTSDLALGGLCAVYCGDDVILGRTVAVKAIAPALEGDYRQALRATASLAHPAVVAVFDAVPYAGWLFLVQEYIPAKPIGHYVHAGVPAQRAVHLAAQLARALAYAHGLDVVHGDLTPAAVLVDRYAVVRINNFALPPDAEYFTALAQQAALAAADERGVAAAPSEVPSEAPSEVPSEVPTGPARDVWAVGALLWQLLATPATHPSAQEGTGEWSGIRRFRPDVPEAVRGLVRQCVYPDEPGAIREAAMLAAALEEVQTRLAAEHPSAAPLTPPVLRAARDAAADAAGRGPLAAASLLASASASSSVFNAPTEPVLTDEAATQPGADFMTPAGAPRLRLPSRPLGEPVAPFASTPPVPRWEPSRVATPGPHARSEYSMSLVTVLVLGTVLFVLCFAIGFAAQSLFSR